MTKQEYFPPEIGKSQFNCPFCNVYAKQWYGVLEASNLHYSSHITGGQPRFAGEIGRQWVATKCDACKEIAFWNENSLVFPAKSIAPRPSNDMPHDVRKDYVEASGIFEKSPRAAAALLRLALQKLCASVGESGNNINDDIKSLVAKGLHPLVQKSLDILRVTGNNAVHPGEINLQEEPEKVLKLFSLINFIVEKLITEPKEIEKIYGELPEGARLAVEKRDMGINK